MPDAAFSKEIHDLASFLEIGIAYGTGYLAFNYFKYRERIYSLLNQYLRRYSIELLPLQSSGTMHNVVQHAANVGPTLQFIAECFTNHSLQSRFVSFFYRQPPSVDKIIIFYLTLINILLLAFVSLSGIELPFSYSLALAGFPAISIIVSSILALWLNKILHEYDRTLDITYKIYMPYDKNSIPMESDKQRAANEQRAAKKGALIGFAVLFMEHRENEDIERQMIALLKEAEEDPDMGDLLDQHALIRYVHKLIKKIKK